jgi:hypothetical protein
MTAHYDEIHGLVISGDDARGGVTGHNARYVLAASMTGIVAAFAAVAIYFGSPPHFRRARQTFCKPFRLMRRSCLLVQSAPGYCLDSGT